MGHWTGVRTSQRAGPGARGAVWRGRGRSSTRLFHSLHKDNGRSHVVGAPTLPWCLILFLCVCPWLCLVPFASGLGLPNPTRQLPQTTEPHPSLQLLPAEDPQPHPSGHMPNTGEPDSRQQSPPEREQPQQQQHSKCANETLEGQPPVPQYHQSEIEQRAPQQQTGPTVCERQGVRRQRGLERRGQRQRALRWSGPLPLLLQQVQGEQQQEHQLGQQQRGFQHRVLQQRGRHIRRRRKLQQLRSNGTVLQTVRTYTTVPRLLQGVLSRQRLLLERGLLQRVLHRRRLQLLRRYSVVPGWGTEPLTDMGVWNFSFPKNDFSAPAVSDRRLRAVQKGCSGKAQWPPPWSEECSEELMQGATSSWHRRTAYPAAASMLPAHDLAAFRNAGMQRRGGEKGPAGKAGASSGSTASSGGASSGGATSGGATSGGATSGGKAKGGSQAAVQGGTGTGTVSGAGSDKNSKVYRNSTTSSTNSTVRRRLEKTGRLEGDPGGKATQQASTMNSSADRFLQFNSSSQVLWVVHMTTCTWQTNRLARVVSALGIPFAVLGLGTVWKRLWGVRMRMLHDFLLPLPEDQLVLFTDSGDVLPTPSASSQAIIWRYKRMVSMYDRRIFFMGSIICWPLIQLRPKFPMPKDLQEKHPSRAPPLKYLNAGIMIGPAGLIRRMIALVYQKDCWDDQYLYSLAFLDPIVWWESPVDGSVSVASRRQTPKELIPAEAKPLIGLDYRASLMVTLSRVQRSWLQIDKSNRSVTWMPTRERPLILHENGGRRHASPLDLYSCDFGYRRLFNTLDDCNAKTKYSQM